MRPVSRLKKRQKKESLGKFRRSEISEMDLLLSLRRILAWVIMALLIQYFAVLPLTDDITLLRY